MGGVIRRGLPALLLAVLAACSSPPARQSAAVERPSSERFELSARVAVRDAARSSASNLYWTHAPERDEIDFLAPTGQVMGRLVSQPGEATLRLANGEERRSESLDALAATLLGFDVPVSRLTHWVQAVAGPQARILRLDPVGRPALVSEQGWVVEYLAYADESPAAPVRRLEARWGELQLNMILDEWVQP